MDKATICVSYHASQISLGFPDIEKARAAYDLIHTALKAFKDYRNDRDHTVEIDTEDGKVALALDRMDAILFNERSPDEMDRIRASLEREKQIRDMRAELGLPETMRG